MQKGPGNSRPVPARRPNTDLEPGIPHREPDQTPGSPPTADMATPGDVEALLRAFYGAALRDDLLGPVFQRAGMRLETHLPRITSFWEVTLLGTGTYAGSPLAVHRQAATASGLGELHFERWLVLWARTVTSMFMGPTATRAVTDAERMAAGMLRDLHRHAANEDGTVGSGTSSADLHLTAHGQAASA